MALSLNQIEHTARKAVRGAGLPWGLAEDAGRAIRQLEMLDLPGMIWLSGLLQRISHHALDPLRLSPTADGWQASGGIISPLLAGPALADRMTLPGTIPFAGLCLRQLACPGICAGYLVMALRDREIAVRFHSNDFSIQVDGQGIVFERGGVDGLCAQPDDVRVEAVADASLAQGRRHASRVGSRIVDPRTLDMLESLAHRTYVEATDASRLSGAGAGLQDND